MSSVLTSFLLFLSRVPEFCDDTDDSAINVLVINEVNVIKVHDDTDAASDAAGDDRRRVVTVKRLVTVARGDYETV